MLDRIGSSVVNDICRFAQEFGAPLIARRHNDLGAVRCSTESAHPL